MKETIKSKANSTKSSRIVEVNQHDILSNVGENGQKVLGEGEYLIVQFVENSRITLLYFTKSGTFNNYIMTNKDFNSYYEMGFFKPYRKKEDIIDITPVKDRLLELPPIERILPKSMQIDEEVFNYVKEGVLPEAEEMRIILLRYHKAVKALQTNIDLYNELLFGKEEEKTVVSEEPINQEEDLYNWKFAETIIPNYTKSGAFTAQILGDGRIAIVEKKDLESLIEENKNVQESDDEEYYDDEETEEMPW